LLQRTLGAQESSASGNPDDWHDLVKVFENLY